MNAAPLYSDALKRSNFVNTDLTYKPNRDNNNSSTRPKGQRNVIWYNPLFSKNVRTSIGRDFLQLIDKHFPPSHKLHQIFNRHTVRVSYSCMDNMKTLIQKHNKHILTQNVKRNQTTMNKQTTCNCKNRDTCPLAGKCLMESVVYRADVTATDNKERKSYIGVTANDFKQRYNLKSSGTSNMQMILNCPNIFGNSRKATGSSTLAGRSSSKSWHIRRDQSDAICALKKSSY